MVGIFILSMPFFGIANEALEQPKQEEDEKKEVVKFEVKASEYNIRVGEELRSFGWKLSRSGEKFCTYQGSGKKHFIKADIFDTKKCPNILVGVRKLKQADDKKEI